MNPLNEFTESLPLSVKQTGSSLKNPDELALKAGSLKLKYSNGALRYISSGGTELIRMIYSAVRDKNWLTINPVIISEKIESKDDSFRIELQCDYKERDIDFSAGYVIEGTCESTIALTMEGFAAERFEKNRIGFCVLHPVEGYEGKNCIIGHSNNITKNSSFPFNISPVQIFTDVRSMSWSINEANCRIDFEGDIFETEDQRNWTDASFKTYSTPLSFPYPVTVEKGTRIFQKVTFKCEGTVKPDFDPDEKSVIRLFPEDNLRLPSIGICRSSRTSPLTPGETRIIRSLRFDHYRIDLHLYKSGWQFIAEQGCQESFDFGYSVEIALFFDDNRVQQINNFMDWYSRRKLSVSSILLFHKDQPSTPDNLAREIIPILRRVNPGVRIATGTNASFAQLNRNRPGETDNNSICYSIHPQEHASDNATLTENLAAQEYSIESAKVFSGEKGIVISPVTIQRRFNANVAYFELPDPGKEIPPQVDSRLMSLFGACWTVGSLKYICENGIESITYFETVGERGIIQGELDSLWPDNFPAVAGMIFPVFHVFRFLLSNKDLKLIRSKSSKPLAVDSLALSDGKQVRMMLVNFTESIQSLRLECCSGLFRIRTLGTLNFSEAAFNYRWTGAESEKTVKSVNTFELEPYSINFIEGWKKH